MKQEVAMQQDETQEPAPIRLALVSTNPLMRLRHLVARAEELVQEILAEADATPPRDD